MSTQADTPRNHGSLTARLALVACAMFGFGYALVPLYELMCEVTGINGKTGRAEAAEVAQGGVDKSRLITVEFVGSVNTNLPWTLQPVVKSIQVHPGALTEVEFLAGNRSREPRMGQAVPSVSPAEASRYFFKTECFCFTDQTLAGGEERMMPVRFVVDARLPKHISKMTLSYTFFGLKPAVEGADATSG